MSVLETGDLTLPVQKLDPWISSISNGSVISSLSPNLPMQFGKGEAFTFGTDEAEYVGESQQKGDSDYTSTQQTIDPFKFHKTVRFSNEVMWASEDAQTEAVDRILAEIQPALSRALDYGVIHGVNPKTGTRAAQMTQFLANSPTGATFDGSGAVYLAIDEADQAILEAGNLPSSIAVDPQFAARFAALRDEDGRKLYPDVSYAVAPSTLENHRSSVSRTVSGQGVLADASGILAIVGDFTAVRWGIQKSIGLELIEYGDPDGNGDLKRNNQVAFRAEVVYGWGIADKSAFSLIKSGSDGEDGGDEDAEGE